MSGAEIFGASIAAWLTTYGYWVLIPIMIFEGTTAGFFAGALASVGVFNPFILFGVYLAVRFSTDTILYISALHGSAYLKRFSWARNVIRKFHGESKSATELKNYLDKHFIRSLFLAKVLPFPTLDGALIVAAGTLKISARKMYLGILAGQPIWSGMVIGLGFFFGDTIRNPQRIFNVIGFTLGGIIVLTVLYNKYAHNYLIRHTQLGRLLNSTNNNKKVHEDV